MGISKAGSMKGYSLKVWIVKNKDTLKYLLMGVSGVMANISIDSVIWKWVATVVVPVLVKLGIDAIDFWTSEVKI